MKKLPFVSIHRASIELGIPEEDIKYNLEEGHLTTYIQTPAGNLVYNKADGKLAKLAKARQARIIGDKISYEKLHLLDKDTMEQIEEIPGGWYYVKDILISRAEIEDLHSIEKREGGLKKQVQKTPVSISQTADQPSTNRTSQIHKEKVRSVAKKMWEKNKVLTIQEVIYSNEINSATEPHTYNERTLRRWVKDLAPNRKPGRRPKSSNFN